MWFSRAIPVIPAPWCSQGLNHGILQNGLHLATQRSTLQSWQRKIHPIGRCFSPLIFPNFPKKRRETLMIGKPPNNQSSTSLLHGFFQLQNVFPKKTSLLPPEPGSDRAACHQCPAGGWWSPCLWWQSPLAGLRRRGRGPPRQMTSGINYGEVTKKNGILGSSKMASWESPELNDCF